MRIINIEKYLKTLLKINDIENDDTKEILKVFVRFMEDNNWFDIKPTFIKSGYKTKLYIEQYELVKIHNKLVLFFKYRNLSLKDKVVILSDMLKNKFPLSYNDINLFFTEHEFTLENKYTLYDFILWSLKKDFRIFNDDYMNDYVALICNELPITLGTILIQFFEWLKSKHTVKYVSSFVLNNRVYRGSNEAYDSDTYLKLIYYLFNTEYINENCLYKRAVDNKNTIDTWLYLSLHCICALRDTDLYQLPHPRIKGNPSVILESISNGTFSNTDALANINSILWQLKNLPIVPSKTSKYSGISNIKLLIPESTKIHFGILFTIAECHYILANYSGNEPLIRKISDYSLISRYLNDDIGNLFITRNFSPISASKTYMQSIEVLTDKLLDDNSDYPHAKGYMLAALARSHKSSYGEFAKTTEIYLRDANFSGYTEEFIAKELFERGVCSFIPSMLLKMITNGAYDKLTISKQTELIKALDMDAYDVETFVSTFSTSITKAQSIVTNIFSTTSDKKELLNILHNIGCGNAISKTEDSLCIMIAMNKICPYIEARQCIGCTYEISTKSTVFVLVKEFQRLLKLRYESTNELIKAKHTKLLKEVITPKIEDILIYIKEYHGEEALKELEYIIKEIASE